MHGKQQLISPALAICLLGSIVLHLLLLRSSYWNSVSTPAQIELLAGQSAVELTLLPSVATPPAEPDPKPEPPPQPVVEEPPPAPIVNEPTELSCPEPKEEPEPPPEAEPVKEPEPEPPPEPEKPQVESVEQDADLKQKGVETSAEQLRAFQPRYPRLSRRRGEEGHVTITLTVLADGSADNITVSRSSGYPLLDKAALGAVRKSRYKPATKKGRPVESTIEQEFIFRLENQ